MIRLTRANAAALGLEVQRDAPRARPQARCFGVALLCAIALGHGLLACDPTGLPDPLPASPEAADRDEGGDATPRETASSEDSYCDGSEEGMYNCANTDVVSDEGAGQADVPGAGANREDVPGVSGTGEGAAAGGDDPGGAEVGCTAERFETGAGRGADLLLVIDRSNSMAEATETSSNSKWNQLVPVVTAVTAELEPDIDFGLALFPVGVRATCMPGEVVQPVASGNAQAIGHVLSTTWPNGGGTPTADTLEVARAYLTARENARSQAVVLVTDGGPNCNDALDVSTCVCTDATGMACGGYGPHAGDSTVCLDDVAAVAAVQQLAQDGLATFVVGFPLNETFAAVLDRMAVAGGTARSGARRYYEAATQEALASALRALGQRAASCRFVLAAAPQEDPLSVQVNGAPADRDATRADGWDFVGARTIEFFGQACEALVAGGQEVAVEYCRVSES